MLTFLLIISTFSLLVKVRSGLLLLFWLYYFTIFINKCQYFLIFLICLTLLDNGLICFYSRKPCVSISVSIILIRNIMKFHITTRQNKKNIVIYMLYILGCSQAVRQMALTHRCVGSNPTTPAISDFCRITLKILVYKNFKILTESIREKMVWF